MIARRHTHSLASTKRGKKTRKYGVILSSLRGHAAQHARGDAIALDEMMPGGGRDMQHDQREQRIGEKDMAFLPGAGSDLIGRGDLRNVEPAEEARIVLV